MATKTINTRIGLKYDVWSKWFEKGTWSEGVFTPNENAETTYASGFTPIKGEVVFVAVPASTGEVASEPAILFKVGDGVTDLEHLPWGSGLAADVYAWAKKTSLLGGTWSEENGWSFPEGDETTNRTRNEMAAFISTQNSNYVKVKLVPVTEENFESIYGVPFDRGNQEHVNKIGKYQTLVSTDEGNTWTPTGDPSDIGVTVEKKRYADDGYAASYIIKQGGVQVGETINIPKDYLVKSADLRECTVADEPVTGMEVGDKYLDFVVNTKDTVLYWTQQDADKWAQAHPNGPAFPFTVGAEADALPAQIPYIIVNDETSFNSALANYGLDAYYEYYPAEDRWNAQENRAANFNDRAYDCTVNGETRTFRAHWQSTDVQQLTEGANTYYMSKGNDVGGYKDVEVGQTWTVYNDSNLTDPAFDATITRIYYPDCIVTYNAAVANGARFPWLVFDVRTPGAGQITLVYDGTEYYPYGGTYTKFAGGFALCSLPNELGIAAADIDLSKLDVIFPDTNKHIYIPVNDLVDVYTGSEGDDIDITVDSHNAIHAAAKYTSLNSIHGTVYTFESYGSAEGGEPFTTGTAEQVAQDASTTTVKILTNPGYEEFVGQEFTVNATEVTEGTRYQLYQNGQPVDLWVAITETSAPNDGIASAADVKTYVDEHISAATPNIEAGDGIEITTSGSTKTVAVELDENHNESGITGNTGSGLTVGPNGLAIDDSLTWYFQCGGAE